MAQATRPATKEFQDRLTELSTKFDVPGTAAGILIDGEEQYAFHGITSIENPLPVDENTLFQFGSTGKTYTATAMMVLVEQGLVDLDERVKTYIPEFKLKDKHTEANVSVLQLFNHTAGWSGDVLDDTGFGDDALEKYVALLADVEQEFPLGKAASYNNAALSVAGRVIEKVTGKTYEDAIKELIFEPLGMKQSFFHLNDIATRRFVVGHTKNDDGSPAVARPLVLPRGGWPAGGISSTVGDLLAWAKFHLGDGSPLLSKESLDRMKEPTSRMGDDADYIGISWMLSDIDGVRVVAHGGNTVGQSSAFQMIPERNFAIAVMANGEGGGRLEHEMVDWAFESYAGVVRKELEPVKRPASDLTEYLGTYETIAVVVEVTSGDGGVLAKPIIKPEAWAKIAEGDPPDEDPYPLGFLEASGDRYMVSEGQAKGMKGYFTRDESGVLDGIHLGGRLAMKVK